MRHGTSILLASLLVVPAFALPGAQAAPASFSWGSYAKILHAPAGAMVVFTAWAGDESARSTAYRRP